MELALGDRCTEDEASAARARRFRDAMEVPVVEVVEDNSEELSNMARWCLKLDGWLDGWLGGACMITKIKNYGSKHKLAIAININLYDWRPLLSTKFRRGVNKYFKLNCINQTYIAVHSYLLVNLVALYYSIYITE